MVCEVVVEPMSTPSINSRSDAPARQLVLQLKEELTSLEQYRTELSKRVRTIKFVLRRLTTLAWGEMGNRTDPAISKLNERNEVAESGASGGL